jgi:hypothetical protein
MRNAVPKEAECRNGNSDEHSTMAQIVSSCKGKCNSISRKSVRTILSPIPTTYFP